MGRVGISTARAAREGNPILEEENQIQEVGNRIIPFAAPTVASGVDARVNAPAVAAVAAGATTAAVASPLHAASKGEATARSTSDATGATTAASSGGDLATFAATSATSAAASHADFVIRSVAPSAAVSLLEALTRATDAATAVAPLVTWRDDKDAGVDECCSREFWAAVAADDGAAAGDEDWILAVDSLGLWWLFGNLDGATANSVTAGEDDSGPGLCADSQLETQYVTTANDVEAGVTATVTGVATELEGAKKVAQCPTSHTGDELIEDSSECSPSHSCNEERYKDSQVFVSEFEARAPFLHFSLSEHAARVASSPNAGGASVISEIKYCDSNWKKVDYICSLFGQRFGVSVTRAMMYPDPALFDSHRARALLRKKLHGLVVAWSGVSPMHCFSRAILHVWCETSHIANLLQEAFPEVSSLLDMQEDVLMVLTVAEGHQGWPIFYESLYKVSGMPREGREWCLRTQHAHHPWFGINVKPCVRVV
ncbi:hypothetical protein CLOM_g19235 [Closterium sp. NIES-68]|nr:hypothetical protein CLOM_g19235 [Closterium sp. NIES-68]